MYHSDELTVAEQVRQRGAHYKSRQQPFTSRQVWLCLGCRPAFKVVSKQLSRLRQVGELKVLDKYHNRGLIYQ